MNNQQSTSPAEYQGEKYIVRYLFTEEIAKEAMDFYWKKNSRVGEYGNCKMFLQSRMKTLIR